MTIGRSLEKGAGEARIVRKGPKEIKKNKGSIATAQACLKMVFKTQQFETVLSFFYFVLNVTEAFPTRKNINKF